MLKISRYNKSRIVNTMKDSKLLREFIRESISSKAKIDEGFFSDVGSKISNFLGFGDNEDPIDKQKENQALGELIPLSKVLELDKDKRALIIGSEQVKSIGRYVRDMLASKGFSNIDFVTQHFSSVSDITSHVQGSINSSKNDIAIIFAGFKQGSDANDAIELVNLFKKGTCFVVAPPPVTLITDLDRASRIGLGEPSSISDDYWFRLKTKAGQNYCDEREDFVSELARVVSATGGTLLNPRDMGLGGEYQPTGLSFPSSPDGIYPSPSTSQQIASNIIDEIFSSQAQVKVSDVMANISKEDIEKPGFLDTLRGLPGFGMLFSLFKDDKDVNSLKDKINPELDDQAKEIQKAYPLMSSYADEIVRVAKNVGISPNWLANVINFESGGNPQSKNTKSSATGIIQFISTTATNLGTSVNDIYNMTGREQMAWVEKYLAPYAGKMSSQEDVYMAVFYPAAIGKPDYRFSEEIVAANNGIETPRDYFEKANRNAKLA